MTIKSTTLAAFAVGTAMLSGCATNYSVSSEASASQTVTYAQGVATTESVREISAVKVSPLGPNSVGQLRFAVAVLNKSGKPFNLGYENVSARFEDGKPLRLFNRSELEGQARSRAMWAQAAVAAAGGLSAYAANQSAYSTTRGTIYNRYGATNFTVRSYDPAVAYAGTAAAGAATGASIATIQSSLNDIIGNLRGSILQTTTINPGQGYGGEVIADRFARGGGAKKIFVTVNVEGEIHEFQFAVTAS